LLRLGHRVTGITTDGTLPMAGGPVRHKGPGFAFVVCPARARAWRFNGRHPGRVLDLFNCERRLLRRVMVEVSPDIVHAHWSYEFALAAIEQPAPHLITCHDSPTAVLRFTRSPYRALRWLMARQVFARGQHFTTVSPYMCAELPPRVRARAAVVPNPVACQAFRLGRARPLPATRRVAMICNGWDARKNPQAALRGFANWRHRQAEGELHVFGAGFAAGEVAHRWAVSEGLAHGVHFHGRVSHAALLREVAEFDVLLHPSLEESFGVVIAEAMALGLPIVAGRASGAVPWVVGASADGVAACALLVDVRSAEEICAALAEVFDNGYTARSAAGVARAGSAFTVGTIVKRYLELYTKAGT
jgi:glycosyltransferase involved in cell wall biosynthesis